MIYGDASCRRRSLSLFGRVASPSLPALLTTTATTMDELRDILASNLPSHRGSNEPLWLRKSYDCIPPRRLDS